MAWWNVRVLVFLGLLLLPAGLFAWAFADAFLWFETCVPDIGAHTVGFMLLFPLPGLLCAGFGSARAVGLLGGRGQPWRAAAILLASMVCLAVSVLWVMAHDGGYLIPLDGAQITPWEKAMSLPFFLLSAWPLVTLLASIAPPGDVAPGA